MEAGCAFREGGFTGQEKRSGTRSRSGYSFGSFGRGRDSPPDLFFIVFDFVERSSRG